MEIARLLMFEEGPLRQVACRLASGEMVHGQESQLLYSLVCTIILSKTGQDKPFPLQPSSSAFPLRKE